MVKIIKRKFLGIQPVYDIGLAEDHNFLLEQGLVASNCFNKSHSTAYAYVTYQTAYLKANYPVEYMTALLTASSDSQDKVEKYRENAEKMGIPVKQPNINQSQKDFTPMDQSILFGFSAVRNLGEGAIDNILQARAKDGDFTSLADFCSRVDLRIVSRRALEPLIYCGAFDKLNPNRNQLIQDIELIIPWAQKRAKEKESGQMNIFDLVGESANQDSGKDEFEQAPSAKSVPDFPLQERLKWEKEYLGFYVSEHPLNTIKKSASVLSPINLRELEEQKARQKISTIAILTAVKKIITKKGTPMAFITLEDMTGQSEAVVFSDTYERIESLLVEDSQLILWGKVDKRDDKTQMIVEDAEPIESVKMVMVRLSPQQAINTETQRNLREILRRQSGEKKQPAKVPVVAIIGQGKDRQFVRLGQDYWVKDDTKTVNLLENAGFDAYAEPLVNTSS
ncbi:MAG: OB-fold nucleic acid binding domain-containing protein [Microcystaceae cyanobacterium]